MIFTVTLEIFREFANIGLTTLVAWSNVGILHRLNTDHVTSEHAQSGRRICFRDIAGLKGHGMKLADRKSVV